MIDARRDAAYDPELWKLFALFDIRGDGAIEPDEFCLAQLYVAQAFGEDIGEAAQLPLLRSADLPAPPALARATSWHAMRQAGFGDVDRDGDGRVRFEEFRCWLLEMFAASRANSATKRRRLALMVADLEKRLKRAQPRQCWAEAEQILGAAGDLEALERASANAVSLGITIDPESHARLEGLRQEAAAERRRRAPAYEAQLVGAATVPSLKAALEAAAAWVQHDVLRVHEQRLVAMMTPFPLAVSTLAGFCCEVEARRDQTVATVIEDVARALGEKAYRVRLAHETGNLEPASLTLEACGVVGEQELVALFNEIDPVQEMSLEEFKAEAVRLKVLPRDAVLKKEQVQPSDEEWEAWRKAHTGRLVARIEAEERERREQREREERERREQREREERQRLERLEREAAERRERRAPVEGLTYPDLLQRGAAAGFTGLDRYAGLPEAEARELLIERVSFAEGAVALQHEIEAMVQALADDEDRGNDEAQQLDIMKVEAERVLSPCMDDVLAALHAVQRLDRHAIIEWRALKNPPEILRRLLTAVMMLLLERPVRVKDEAGSIVEDWWRTALGVTSYDQRFLQRLLEYDKDNIPPIVVRRVQATLDKEPALDPDNVDKVSRAGPALLLWVRAMLTYHRVALEIAPQREALAAGERRLREVQCRMHAARERLSATLEKKDRWLQQLASMAPPPEAAASEG